MSDDDEPYPYPCCKGNKGKVEWFWHHWTMIKAKPNYDGRVEVLWACPCGDFRLTQGAKGL